MLNRLGFEWLLAWRIVRAKKSRFLNVITVVAIVGIAFGVMQLTVVLSVTGGFQESFRDRILGLHPHLLVWPADDHFADYREVRRELLKDPRVTGATPATYDEVMIAHGERRAGAVLKGVDLETVGDVMDIDLLLTEGALAPLAETPTVTPKPTGFTVEGLVQETSWTAVIWGDDQLALHPDEAGAPLPDEAHVVVLNADAALGPIDVGIRESSRARAEGLAPGAWSLPVVLPAGAASLQIGDEPVEGGDVQLASGRAYLFVVGPKRRGTLLPMEPGRPQPGLSRVRVIDVRAEGAPARSLRIGDETIEVGETATVAAAPPGIVLGAALAERLNATIGDKLAVSSPYRGLSDRGSAPMGMEPTAGRFRVDGIFESGYYDYDKRVAIVAFPAALRFLNTGDRARWLELQVDEPMAIEDRKITVQNILEPYSIATMAEDLERTHRRIDAVLTGEVSQFDIEEPKSVMGILRNSAQVLTVLRTGMPHTFSRSSSYSVITWQEVNRPLFQALELQKLVLSIFFLIIIVVAAFNIVGTQIMMVHRKTKEIAILKALGSNRFMVRRVFLIQGFIVAALGTLTGLIVGLGACLLLDVVGYPLEPEVYLISELPVTIDLVEVAVVCVAALFLTFASTMYSASKAGRLLPAEGIRYIE